MRRRAGALAILAAALAVALACRSGAPAGPAAPAGSVPETEVERWVESTLDGLDLRQRAAQLLFPRVYGGVAHPDSPQHRELLGFVRELEVGGVVIFASERDALPIVLNELQAAARVPLLVAADVERSLGFRVAEGTVSVPYAMALGATRSVADARFVGELTGRESRAVGVHWALAPVVDVNVNPRNPVINIRSFGEDPALVAELGAAFVEGARAAGVLTTAKHFPGHGDTAVDSHLALPVIGGSRERLAAVELPPFRRAIEAGVDTVMLGHLAVPAIDPSGTPATLSAPLTTGLLRDELGFRGLAVTDAMDMSGVGDAWMGAAVVAAVAAGSDVVLLPPDPRVALESLVRAVEEGELDAATIDRAARRVLATKARLGLHRGATVDPLAARHAVGRPEDQARADQIARRSITVLRNGGGVLPLAVERPLSILHLVLSSDWVNAAIGGIPERELAARGVGVTHRRLGPTIAPATLDELVAQAGHHSHVVVSAFVRQTSSKGNVDLDPGHRELIERLAAGPTPLVVVSHSSPYLLMQIPSAPVYLTGYGPAASSQRAAIAALFGEYDVGGKLPVTLPGVAERGDGLEIAERPMTLERAVPEAAGFRAGELDEVGRILETAIADGAFPGAVVAVGHRGRLAYLEAFGRQTFDPGAPAMTADTIFDLASLTKVVATTTAAMILVDEGRLDLDARVQDYLPRFVGANKERVTVRHLLTHSSGIDWWAPLFREISGQAAYVERIQAMPLVAEPGERTLYSDLGLILLGEILERVAGVSLERFVAERVFAPLRMDETRYRPPAELLPRIAPTELDAAWRGRIVHGEVHDENAFALGGVAPHAGLFSTAGDLARFAQMMLWQGTYAHRRIVDRATVGRFTRRAGVVAGSDRALGWDTKSLEGSSAGTLFSPSSYGHTGFTGTSLWIDPERELFVVLLTNRVHPTRENRKIFGVRPAVADAVVRALEPQVATGLDRIAAGETFGLEGKRLGLLVHRASLSADGRHAIDVLRGRGLDVVRLFTPEHGLRGEAAAGEAVASGTDPASGLPITSLYGARRKPEPADLAGIDALVVDLQGAGVRFYTYSSSMLLALEAAAENGVELVVLDRPNPLGGERVEGPLSAPRDVVPASFVNLAPGPLVHGLTLGEMARFANARRDAPAKLTVVPMRGWRRWMSWPDTGLDWVAPSPNLRSAEAALAYPGVGLLEATNLSEGRGTPQPFLFLGAPWLDPAALGLEVPGYRFEPAELVPAPDRGAPDPRFAGETVRGLRVEVANPRSARPYRLGIALLAALRDDSRFTLDAARLTRLIGNPNPAAMLAAGANVDEIVAADAADHAAWRAERQPALLYDPAGTP